MVGTGLTGWRADGISELYIDQNSPLTIDPNRVTLILSPDKRR
jgi:hypothetical protein